MLLASRGEPVRLFADAERHGASLMVAVDPTDPSEAELLLRFPARDLALTGVVRSSEGAPLEGCSVQVLQASGRLDRVRPGSLDRISTDAAGRFAVNGLHAGRARVLVSHPGHLDASEDVDLQEGPSAQVALTMKPSRSATVLIRGSGTGEPVPGAEVRLAVDDGTRAAVELEGQSDEAGLARFDQVPGGALQIRAYHPLHGYAEPRPVAAADLQATIERTLFPGVTFYGRVEDDRGWPVQLEAALVEVRDRDRAVYSTSRIACDVQGAFQVPSVPPAGSVRIHVFDGDFEAFDRVYGDGEELLVRLQRRSWPASVRGRVVDAAGNPLQGASLSYAGPGRPPVPMVLSRRDGRFELPEAPLGTFFLLVMKEGFATPTLGPFEAGEGENDLGDLTLHEGLELAVEVTLEDGRPADRGYCSLRNLDGLILDSSVIVDGRCVLQNLEPGDYLLSVHVAGHATPLEPVVLDDGGTAPLRMKLERGYSLRLRCELPKDADPPSPPVRIELLRGGTLAFKCVLLRGAGGDYGTSFGLAAGEYQVRAWREGAEEVLTETIDVESLALLEGRRELALQVP